MSEEPPRRPFGKWTSLFLIWNGLGALLVLYIELGCWVILLMQLTTETRPPPIFLGDFLGAFLWLCWVPSLPFTTLGVTIVLWRSRQTEISRVLLLYSGVVLVLGGELILLAIVSLGGFWPP